MPSSWLSQYLPVKARSVPCSRVTRYCSGVSFLRHSSFEAAEAAVLVVVLLSMDFPLLPPIIWGGPPITALHKSARRRAGLPTLLPGRELWVRRPRQVKRRSPPNTLRRRVLPFS